MWKCCMHWFGNLRWSHSAYSSLRRCLSMRMVHCLRLLCDVRQACTYMSNAVATCLQRQTNVTIIPPHPPYPQPVPPILVCLCAWCIACVLFGQSYDADEMMISTSAMTTKKTNVAKHPFRHGGMWTVGQLQSLVTPFINELLNVYVHTIYGSTHFTADFCPASNWTLCEWFTLISNSMKSDNTSC